MLRGRPTYQGAWPKVVPPKLLDLKKSGDGARWQERCRQFRDRRERSADFLTDGHAASSHVGPFVRRLAVRFGSCPASAPRYGSGPATAVSPSLPCPAGSCVNRAASHCSQSIQPIGLRRPRSIRCAPPPKPSSRGLGHSASVLLLMLDDSRTRPISDIRNRLVHIGVNDVEMGIAGHFSFSSMVIRSVM